MSDVGGGVHRRARNRAFYWDMGGGGRAAKLVSNGTRARPGRLEIVSRSPVSGRRAKS